MIHIKSLELRDFQTHKRTKIDFSPHFNVIIGATRSGKSSVVRALDFLLYNNWYEDYQRFGSKYTEIKAVLSNNTTVTRTKSKKINKILLTSNKTKPQRFEAFGTHLPTEVMKTLGVFPIEIDAKEPILANIANQDDPLFLLYSTGTERTKVLSRLSGLHWIDFALKDLNKDRRAKLTTVTFLKEANIKLLTQLKSFKNLDKLGERLSSAQEHLHTIKKFAVLHDRCGTLVAKTTQWKREHRELQALKRVDFPKEVERFQKLIHIHTNILQNLRDKARQLRLNEISLKNIRSHSNQLRSSVEYLEKQIEEEQSRTPICKECGQEIKQEVHIDERH